MGVTIRGLSKLLKTLKLVCDVINMFGDNVAEHVPSGNRAAYDAALVQIKAACEVIRAIDFVNDGIGTN